VTVLDGTTQIGSATVAATGGWTANVTLANAGANVLTATDTNAAGTGTSNAVTYDLVTAAPTAPTLSIANSSLTVAGRGGTVPLGISVTAPASSTATTVTITGIPSYESIKDSLDGEKFSGSSVTLSEAEVDSGLTLQSKYRGSRHPVTTLTITATDDIGGVLTTSTPQTITVTDPPIGATAGGDLFQDQTALLNGDTVAGFAAPGDAIDFTDLKDGPGVIQSFMENGAGTAGTLKVSDGTHSASIMLLGQFMASAFVPTQDGIGLGTIITYQPEQQHPLAAPHA
jgi:hypothetical protein